MNEIRFSDENIIKGIKLQKTAVLEHIYDECFPLIRNLVLKNTGEEQDVQDVFQDAMVIVFKKASQSAFVLNCSFKTYLFSVGQYVWLQKLEKRRQEEIVFKTVSHTIELSEEDIVEIIDEEAEKYRIYQKHFLSLDPECQKLLVLFLNKLSVREIAAEMNFKTEQYTKIRKFRCKEELKRRIMNDREYKRLI